MVSKTHLIARYAETDQMGIIHHSVYAVWYEAARTAFVKDLGLSYSEMEQNGLFMPLSELSCQFLRPGLYEDEVLVETRIKNVSASRIQFAYTLFRNGEDTPFNTGSTTHGWVDENRRPFNLKKRFPELFTLFSQAIE